MNPESKHIFCNNHCCFCKHFVIPTVFGSHVEYQYELYGAGYCNIHDGVRYLYSNDCNCSHFEDTIHNPYNIESEEFIDSWVHAREFQSHMWNDIMNYKINSLEKLKGETRLSHARIATKSVSRY